MNADILQRPFARRPWPDMDDDEDLLAWSLAAAPAGAAPSEGVGQSPPLPLVWASSPAGELIREIQKIVVVSGQEERGQRVPTPIRTHSPFRESGVRR